MERRAGDLVPFKELIAESAERKTVPNAVIGKFEVRPFADVPRQQTDVRRRVVFQLGKKSLDAREQPPSRNAKGFGQSFEVFAAEPPPGAFVILKAVRQ